MIPHGSSRTARPAASVVFAAALLSAAPAGADTRSPEQLQTLVTPYAGVPSGALVVIFDSARYPGDLMNAAAWLGKPEAERGPPPATQPSVRRLTEQAPQVVTYLSSDIATTSELGAAYRDQPHELWAAYAEATSRMQAHQGPPPTVTP